MTSFVQTLGSLVRGESSYSNEPDPWENDVPLSFQSVRRESRAKPPPSLRIPRAITLPSLLSLRSHVRNRSSNDHDSVPISPSLSRAPPLSPRSVPLMRQRVVDDHAPVRESSSAVLSRSFVSHGNNAVTSPGPPSRSFLSKSKGAKTAHGLLKNWNGSQLADSQNIEQPPKATNVSGEDIPPLSPVSEDTENEEDRSSRRNWLRGRVRRVLRLKRKERT